jgi:hypothetical protein
MVYKTANQSDVYLFMSGVVKVSVDNGEVLRREVIRKSEGPEEAGEPVLEKRGHPDSWRG